VPNLRIQFTKIAAREKRGGFRNCEATIKRESEKRKKRKEKEEFILRDFVLGKWRGISWRISGRGYGSQGTGLRKSMKSRQEAAKE